MLIETLPPDLAAAMEAEIRRGWELDQALAAARKGDVGKLAADTVRSVDGLGQLTARIDPISFHYWGKRLGYKCWDDKQFVKEYLRDNPQSRVKSTGTKLQVGYTGK